MCRVTTSLAAVPALLLATTALAGSSVACEGGPCDGTNGNDKIQGTAGADTIDAGDGKDLVRANSGDDRVNGGAGPDRLRGSRGQDVLRGEGSADRIGGGRGADRVYAGGGSDVIYANERGIDPPGRDVVRCGTGTRDWVNLDDGDTQHGCDVVVYGGERF